MAITAVIRKIEARIRADRDNYVRMKALTGYCLTPQNSRGMEKCVAFRAFRFSEEDPSLDWVQFEFGHDMSRCRYQDSELLSHWIISFRDQYPDENVIMDAARELLDDLGYGEDRKYTVAIHADTEHVHAHICACRVDPWTGQLVREGQGWWKNESQKALARIAHRHRWEMAPGAKYRVPANPKQEIIECHMPDGSVKEVLRPKVVQMTDRKGIDLRYGERRMEKHTGLKSYQRRLQEALAAFVAEHDKDFPKWKVGHFHKALAELGIGCERVRHGDKYGLTFTLDGERYEAASDVCPELTYEKLMKRIGAKGWRDAKGKIKGILAEARGVPEVPASAGSSAPEETGTGAAQEDDAPPPNLTDGQRRLEQALRQFLAKHEKDFPSWKYGHFHRALAKIGIACERVQEGDAFRLYYSIDDESREPASVVCPEMEYDALIGKIGAQSWRDAREEHRRIMSEARERLASAPLPEAEEPAPPADDAWTDADETHTELIDQARSERSQLPEPMPQEQEKIRYDKPVLDAMRRIAPERVFAALGREPKAARSNGKPIKTAFDACFSAGLTYAQAADFLAERFPEVLDVPDQGDSVDGMIAAVKAQGIDPGKMERHAREIGRFMEILKINELDITTNVPFELKEEWRAQGKRLDNFHDGRNLYFGQIVRSLPVLAKLNMAGRPGEMPVGVFCQPVWPEGRIGFLVDDVKDELLAKHPPSLLLATSDRSAHAFYVMAREHPLDFYDWLAAHLNGKYGDAAVKSVRHPTRLPGFQNQKRLPPSWVRIKSWTREACRSMMELADRLFPKWEAWRKRMAESGHGAISSGDYGAILQAAKDEVWRKVKAERRRCTQAQITEMIMERVRSWDWEAEVRIREMFLSVRHGKLNDFCPPDLEVIGCREQGRLKGIYGERLDRSRCDWEVAGKLYEEGATPGQVHAWLLTHMLQKEEKDGAKRLRDWREIDRQARRIAVKRAPVSLLMADREFRRMIEPSSGPVIDHAALDPERERKEQMDALRTRPRAQERQGKTQRDALD